MASNHGQKEVLTDVVLYLQTVLACESLSKQAETQRIQLLEKLTIMEKSPNRTPYMDMNGRSKGLIMKSNSFACLHQQVAYEELCTNQPIYNNVPYEENELNYELFAGNCYDNSPHNPLKSSAHDKRHSVSNSDSSSQIGSSLIKCTLNSGGSSSLSSSQSNSDSSESSSRSDIIFVSANAVKYSASKYGVLMKREKILFVDHTRKFWAAVLSSTMYVYNGEKEPKPCLVIHLEGYTARDSNIGVSGTKAKDWVFEIVCPGKKTYQFIAQNKKDMQSWIEAVNNSNNKPPSPEIDHSQLPIYFKQESLPNRELPIPPALQDCCYDKPNPIIRAVNLYENPADEVDMESIYHFIDESKQEKCLLSKIDKQFWDGDTSYYNIPSNKPVPINFKEEELNNNEYDEYFTERETGYVVITNDHETTDNQVLGVQQIIQKIEEINNKRTSPFLLRKSPLKNNSSTRNSISVTYTADAFYEPVKMTKNMPGAVTSQSFRKSR